MALLARLNDFAPSTVIVSQQVDDEFNQLVNILNGTSTNKDALVKFNDATNPVLRVDQIGAGTIQHWLQNGTEKARMANNGQLAIGTTQTGSGVNRLAVNADANNASLLVSFQTAGTEKALRLAMEGATSGGLGALEVTKFDGAAVQTYWKANLNGETNVAAGHPLTIASIPTAKTVTLGGQYSQNVTPAGNVSTGETDLHSYTIAANVFANDGDSMPFNFGGDFANNANNKQVRAYFGGTAFFDSTAIAFQNAGWALYGEVIRVSSSAVILTFTYVVNGASGNVAYGRAFSITGLSFTGTLVFKATGQATSNNDIRELASVLRKFGRNNT